MALTNINRFYQRADFVSLLPGFDLDVDQISAQLSSLSLTVPVANVERLSQNEGILVQWEVLPSNADIAAVDGAVAAFTGGVVSSSPVEVESLGVTTALTASLVNVIDVTSTPREKGKYLVTWNSLVATLAVIANTGVRGVVTLTRTRGATSVSRQWEHNWNLPQPQLFGSALTFDCEAGDTIRVLLQVAKAGLLVATAQMAMARVTIDRVG